MHDEPLAVLMDQWKRACACVDAAAMDECDRAADHRLTKHRLDQAKQRHEAERANAARIRHRIDDLIDARGESNLDAVPDYKPSVPAENLGQFTHYGMLEGPLE